jgi:hypothetical protein
MDMLNGRHNFGSERDFHRLIAFVTDPFAKPEHCRVSQPKILRHLIDCAVNNFIRVIQDIGSYFFLFFTKFSIIRTNFTEAIGHAVSPSGKTEFEYITNLHLKKIFRNV